MEQEDLDILKKYIENFKYLGEMVKSDDIVKLIDYKEICALIKAINYIELMEAEFVRLEGIEDNAVMLKVTNEKKIEEMRPYKHQAPFDFGVLNGIDEACRVILEGKKQDADTMFSLLGYKKTEETKSFAQYKKDDIVLEIGCTNKSYPVVFCYTIKNNTLYGRGIRMEEMKAILKKIQELDFKECI